MTIALPNFAPTTTTQADPALGSWLLALSNYLQNNFATVNIDTLTANSSSVLQEFNLSRKYNSYLFVLSNIILTSSGAALQCQMSTNNTTFDTSTAYRYAYTTALANSTTTAVGSASSQVIQIDDTIGAGSGFSYNGQLWLQNPSNTTTHTGVEFIGSREDTGGNFRSSKGGGVYTSTSAVQGIQFFASTSTIASGTIKVYGFLT